MQYEVRISGTGGHGILLAGVVLCMATESYEDLQVVQTQSYSPETRGGYSKSEIILSKKEVLFPKVTKPNLLVALSDSAFKEDLHDMNDQSLVIVDDQVVCRNELESKKFGAMLTYPIFSKSQEQFESSMYANMVLVGILSQHIPYVEQQALRESMKTQIKEKFIEINIQAFNLGATLSPSLILEGSMTGFCANVKRES